MFEIYLGRVTWQSTLCLIPITFGSNNCSILLFSYNMRRFQPRPYSFPPAGLLLISKPHLRTTSRYTAELLRALNLVVLDVPPIDITTRPVPPPVTPSLQAVRQRNTVFPFDDTAVLSTPMSKLAHLFILPTNNPTSSRFKPTSHNQTAHYTPSDSAQPRRRESG